MHDPQALGAALRELEAAKARVERDARAVSEDMKKQLVEQLLPVLDNLDRSLVAGEAAGDCRQMTDGVRMVRAQLEQVLRGYGLERLDAHDRPFDPSVHDAIATLPVHPLHQSRVVEQLAPGYRFGGALLRPARVVVGV